MNTIFTHQIAPDNWPQFPCELTYDAGAHYGWQTGYFTSPPRLFLNPSHPTAEEYLPWTHWRTWKDSATPPTVVPGEERATAGATITKGETFNDSCLGNEKRKEFETSQTQAEHISTGATIVSPNRVTDGSAKGNSAGVVPVDSDWATAAAREIFTGVHIADEDIPAMARIIRKHAPSPQTAGLPQEVKEVKEAVERITGELEIASSDEHLSSLAADLRLLLAHVGKGVGK